METRFLKWRCRGRSYMDSRHSPRKGDRYNPLLGMRGKYGFLQLCLLRLVEVLLAITLTHPQRVIKISYSEYLSSQRHLLTSTSVL